MKGEILHMMIIREEKVLNDVAYKISSVINNLVVSEYYVHCKAASVTLDNKLYLILFDRYFQVNLQVYEYINEYMNSMSKSEQTRRKSLVALKLLFSFLSIFNIKLENMTKKEASKLINFLLGYSTLGEDITLEFKSKREANSVNDYLSAMRSFVRYLNIKNHPLLASGGKRKLSTISNFGESHSSDSFDIKVKTRKQDNIAPKHITLNQYKVMLNHVQDIKDKRLECIIRLMYESGMRSGEVLGLTFEDLKQVKITDGTSAYKVVGRSRFTDKPWQSAKFLMKITDREQYKTKRYRLKNYGYHETYISEDLFTLILEYIDKAHSEQKQTHPDNWNKFCITDSIDKEFCEVENFYIFVNSVGRPYSNKVLYKEVKELFVACNIPVNEDGGRKDGLCHRFRHGFAMFQVKYNNTPLLILMELMHHSSVASTAIYYSPEESDIIELKNELTKNLYSYIKEFSLSKEEN